MNLLQLLVYLNRICRYQAVSGNMFGLQIFCSRDPVPYDHVRLCGFENKCLDLRINRAENLDGVWPSQSLFKGGSYEKTRFTGFDSMGHAWWRNAKFLTWLEVPALVANLVNSHQGTSRNMLSPRNQLARVTTLDCIDLPTST